MAIKRYFANKDNTITNAYEFNLKTRATGANMGQADILEVFSIYGQASTSSSELERFLIEFPTADIASDRTAGTIPASGSVSFYLKLYNAPHTYTVPKNYTLQVKAVSGSWQEGHGLDMDNYTDIVYGNSGSNWIVANNGISAATATVTFTGNPSTDQTITIVSSDGTSRTYVAKGSSNFSSLQFKGDGGAAANATQLELAIENSAGHNGKITVSNNGSGVLTLTQATTGRAGNRAIVETLANVAVVNFSGGDGEWVNEGGDYYTDSSSSFEQSFDLGTEDLEIDVTTLVEQWVNSAGNVLGTKPNAGFGVMLSSSLETEARSYYTKKFFGRGTEFYYKRPVIEARWDSARQDDRGEFYYSSSLAPAEDNMNTLYLYNYVRGQLANIPDVADGPIFVSFFSGSDDDTAPSGSALQLVVDGAAVTHANRNTIATGSHVSTGIYSCSVALTSAATPLDTVYDVWFHHNTAGKTYAESTKFFTGSITPKTLKASRINPTNTYVTTVTNLRSVYNKTETARFRLFIREKDWSPTIYTKASSDITGQTIVSGSYRVYRVVDELDVVPYGTGSTMHTLMSYDITGSYFDLDMSMLQADYAYAIEFSYYNGAIGSWVKQPEIFKFRVE
mgnify:CR=1 FL=1